VSPFCFVTLFFSRLLSRVLEQAALRLVLFCAGWEAAAPDTLSSPFLIFLFDRAVTALFSEPSPRGRPRFCRESLILRAFFLIFLTLRLIPRQEKASFSFSQFPRFAVLFLEARYSLPRLAVFLSDHLSVLHQPCRRERSLVKGGASE